MPGKAHHTITSNALRVLPKWQRDILGKQQAELIRDYCCYPDAYFEIGTAKHREAAKYYFQTDGIQFHYLPDTPIVESYRYFRVDCHKQSLELVKKKRNENYRHAKRGFQHYLGSSIASFGAEKIKDACCFIGCLFHMLQDACFGLHSMEGPYGTDIFVLNRLFPEPTCWEELPSNMLDEAHPFERRDMQGYRPNLLGLSIDEAVFHLYTRYVRANLQARRDSFEIVMNTHHGKSSLNGALYRRMYRNVIGLCADVLFTVLSIAHDTVPANIGYLDRIVLSDMEPIERPWGSCHYRFLTMLRDRMLSNSMDFVPLKTRVRENGKSHALSFAKGLGVGSHYKARIFYDVPCDVYAALRTTIGLDAECVTRANVTVTIINNGRKAKVVHLIRSNPSERVTVARPRGKVGFILSNREGITQRLIRFYIGGPLLIKNTEKE